MKKVLEIEFSGWTATPRMPFILSGNALCLHTPTYSLLLGMMGCCLGRLINPNEVSFGFHYSFDSVANDLETRQRLEFDGKKIKSHSKGSDAYSREFHISPKLTLWLDRLDWQTYFENPIGTPSLGRSQDILKIESVKQVEVLEIESGSISGTLIPFDSKIQAGGQLVQLAEAYLENDTIGSGRTPTKSGVYLSIPHDNQCHITHKRLFNTTNVSKTKCFYLHEFEI